MTAQRIASKLPLPSSTRRTAISLIAAALTLAFASFALDAASAPAAFADEAAGSPCQPTSEDLARYEADGTLAERQAFQDALGHDRPDPALIQQAIARQNAADGVAANAVPTVWQGGMPTEGTARVVLLRVSFPAEGDEPAYGFAEGDTLEALEALVDGNAGAYPYESLAGYYGRSSYGKLAIEGEAFDYHAQHARSYYTYRIKDLYLEALAALDATVDFSRFDGNGDGLIDAIYLHFAGGDGGWGTTWWSNADKMVTPATFDGVSPCKYALLHLPSNTADAVRTVIHETGHILGLPDYYSYRAQSGSTSGRSGSLTFDMMDNNTGDHNGFSKWLLGWIGDDDVTRVVATSGGIDVTRGGETIARVDTAPDGTSSAQIDLGAFIGDDGGTGGIAVVSNANEGPFASYYLLQYDRYGGNQSVDYLANVGTEPIPSGFRMFRIQAELTADGADFVHSNAQGSVNDQLIELVDLDMAQPHRDVSGLSPSASSGGYGCMLSEGDEVTPDTYPSTNFYESQALGYTGISVRADACGANGGTLTVSHTGKDAPDLPDFTISLLEGQSLNNMASLRFEASLAPHLAASPEGGSTRIIVDGMSHPAEVAVDGTEITASRYFDPDGIAPDSTCEIVFPAGQFIISQEGDDTAFSPEIRIPLEADAVASIARAGAYRDAAGNADPHRMTDIVELADGTRAFFYSKDGRVALGTLSDDGTALRTAMVDADVELPSASGSAARALPLENGRIALILPSASPSTRILFVDAQTGAVTADDTLEDAWNPVFAASENGLVAIHYSGSGCAVVSLRPNARGGLAETRGTIDVSDRTTAGDGAFALIRYDEQGNPTITIVSAQALSDELDRAAAGSAGGENAPAIEMPESAVPIDCGDYRGIIAADADENGIALVMNAPVTAGPSQQKLGLLAYAPNGTPEDELTIDSHLPSSTFISSDNARVDIAAGGAVAVTLRAAPAISGFCANEALLFAQDDEGRLAFDSRLLANSPGAGAWLADGGWLSVGWGIDENPYAVGSPDMDATAGAGAAADEGDADGAGDADAGGPADGDVLLYYATEPIPGGSAEPDEPDDPEEPDNPADPDDPVDPDAEDPDDSEEPDGEDGADGSGASDGTDGRNGSEDADGSEGSVLVRTGDAAPPLIAAALPLFAGAAALLAALRHKA